MIFYWNHGWFDGGFMWGGGNTAASGSDTGDHIHVIAPAVCGSMMLRR